MVLWSKASIDIIVGRPCLFTYLTIIIFSYQGVLKDPVSESLMTIVSLPLAVVVNIVSLLYFIFEITVIS